MAAEDTPYVGPKPFEEADEQRFFGREEEIAELVSLIYSQPQLLVYAASGAGKTSLINAGVLPQLRKDGLDVLPVARVRPRRRTRGLNPTCGYMLEALSSMDPSRSPRSLVEQALPSFMESRPRPSLDGWKALRVLVFDQLEEILIPASERFLEEQERFFRQVAAALEADPLLRVVFVVRDEDLAKLEPFAPLLPEGLGVPFRLDRLRPEAALVAVREPLGATGWHFGSGVAERLVDDLRTMRVETTPGHTKEIQGDFVEPVQLQVVCQRLWERLPAAGGTITLRHLKLYGDVSRALTAFYESALRRAASESGEDEWRLRVWFETKLITPAGTRGIVYQGPKETDGISNKAVGVFEEMHLVRGGQRAGANWFELTHDRFIGPIQDSNRRAQLQTRLPTGKRGRLIWGLAVVAGIGAVGLLILGWLALSPTIRAATLRLVAVLIAAFLPGWFYLNFLQTRMRLLWDEYVLTLFRIRIDSYGALPEPPLASRYHQRWELEGGKADDTSNLYLRKFEVARGRGLLPALRGYGRVALGRQALGVVLLYSLLNSVGWWFILRPDLPGVTPLGLGQTGLGSALQYAFIGAYLTGLWQIIGSRAVDRLSAATYVRLSTRLLVVSLAVILLDLLLAFLAISPDVERVLAFLIGIFPRVGVQAIRAAIAKMLKTVVPTLETRYPLSDLDGLSVWDETALAEQGIEDMHGLVTANLVDLLLETRVPVARLIDWLDQALLYLHVPRSGRTENSPRYALRTIGIRTATDLEHAWELGNRLDGEDGAIHEVLARAVDGSDGGAARIELILNSIRYNTTFYHVQQFRKATRDRVAAVPTVEEVEEEQQQDQPLEAAPGSSQIAVRLSTDG